MNTRPLNVHEAANLAALNAVGMTSVLLFVTATGLKKSILDATIPMRALFRNAGLHDFDAQPKGPDAKVVLDAALLSDTAVKPAALSLYRPLTKDGDPRMWFYGLKDSARENDVLAVFVVNGRVQALNLSTAHFGDSANLSPALTNFFAPLQMAAQKNADELLARLRELAERGPICSVRTGDTSVGMSIEAALGIAANSRRTPDYNGIEIKSGRSRLGGKQTLATLFACVPDWNLSSCKSSAEILQRFGYQRGANFKLNCTVSTRSPNGQKLQFQIDDLDRLLREVAMLDPQSDVAVWRLSHLETRLAEKHCETFWIKATPEIRAGKEWFHLQSVMHTRTPNIPQFERLLAEGAITMDHLIERKPSGGAAEKGPLFRIQRQRIPELFLGKPTVHSLE